MGNSDDSNGAGEPAPIILRARTVKIIVRHSADCGDKSKGSEWRRCTCHKAIVIYEGGGGAEPTSASVQKPGRGSKLRKRRKRSVIPSIPKSKN